MDWKRFYAPMHEEMRKEQIWPTMIASLGVAPAVYFAREAGSFWVCLGVILLWSIIVYLFYLVYLYNRNRII